MRKLSWKLGGALLLLVVISVGLMAYLTNISTAREFRQYVSTGNTIYTQNLAARVAQFYIQQRNWTGIQDVLNLMRFGNERLIVADSSGTIVGDTAQEWLGKSAQAVKLESGTPIAASGQQVGTLYVFSSGSGLGMGGMMSGMMGGRGQQPLLGLGQQDFLNRVNHLLWVAGLIAAGVALIIGMLLTRQVTRPVRELTRGARQIAQGDLSYRVKVKSRDELGELGQSFNSMASRLDQNEQSRRRLVADIVHELRTPLTVIEGTVDAIIDGVFPSDRDHLLSIKEQTVLLTRIIGDLRDLSLAESGQLKLELSPTDMVELVRRKLFQYEPKAREKNITLNLNAPQPVPAANVDTTRMEQVITNLLSNAIRHTPSGGTITASVSAVSNGSEHHVVRPSVVVSVADTGEGIASEHLPHIFDRFYRVQDARSRGDGGVGLGLAIVKQMVTAHGGQVWVKSEPGKGSAFYFAIPSLSG